MITNNYRRRYRRVVKKQRRHPLIISSEPSKLNSLVSPWPNDPPETITSPLNSIW
jgi:hypothetical protein